MSSEIIGGTNDRDPPRIPTPTLDSRSLPVTGSTWRIIPAPDGRHFALEGDFGVRIYRIRETDLEQRTHIPEACIGFSPNGKWFITGDTSGHVSLYKTETLSLVKRRLVTPHAIYNIAFLTNTKVIFFAKNGRFYELDLRTWNIRSLFVSPISERCISSWAISSDGSRVAVGFYKDDHTYLFEPKQGLITLNSEMPYKLYFLTTHPVLFIEDSVGTKSFRLDVRDGSRLMYSDKQWTFHACYAEQGIFLRAMGNMLECNRNFRSAAMVGYKGEGSVYNLPVIGIYRIEVTPDGRYLLAIARANGIETVNALDFGCHNLGRAPLCDQPFCLPRLSHRAQLDERRVFCSSPLRFPGQAPDIS